MASQVQLNAALAEKVPHAVAGEDYYDKLGVTKIINAAGTYTAMTASIMPPSVQAAVAAAVKHPVHLAELQKSAGEYLAQKLKCEAAMVTAGASSGLTLGAAACVMLANNCTILDIPTEILKMKDEVIIQKGHRYCGSRKPYRVAESAAFAVWFNNVNTRSGPRMLPTQRLNAGLTYSGAAA